MQSFKLRDSNGKIYTALRIPDQRDESTHQQPTTRENAEGLPRYKLDDGRALNVNDDAEGVTFTIVENGVVLTRVDQ